MIKGLPRSLSIKLMKSFYIKAFFVKKDDGSGYIDVWAINTSRKD